jgi:hypothetical protein
MKHLGNLNVGDCFTLIEITYESGPVRSWLILEQLPACGSRSLCVDSEGKQMWLAGHCTVFYINQVHFLAEEELVASARRDRFERTLEPIRKLCAKAISDTADY